jgi:hypothetical protein
VSIYCKNAYNNASYSFIHYVQYPIRGLLLQEKGAYKNTDFRLNFTIEQGSVPQFRVLLNGVVLSYTYDAQLRILKTSLLTGYSTTQNLSVEIHAWNQLSSVSLFDSFQITSPIVNPQIRVSTSTTGFPGPILFEYTMDSGSDVQISFNFGDTLPDVPVMCRYSGDYPINLWSSCPGSNRAFSIPGTLTVIVIFSNSINSVIRYTTVTLTSSIEPIEVVSFFRRKTCHCVLHHSSTKFFGQTGSRRSSYDHS